MSSYLTFSHISCIFKIDEATFINDENDFKGL
jgi:hypothetical protein